MFSGRYVPGIGPPGARIALVGEAPGGDEEQRGIPFVGPSGQLLNSMLSKAGIDRNSCYLTNVCKIRPPGNDFGAFYEDPKTRRKPTPFLANAIQELHAELSRQKPNIIVPLGNEPLRAITGKQGISKWRGSLLGTPLGKCCATFHPASVLRVYLERTTVERDLRRVAEEANSPELRLPSHSFQIAPSFSDVVAFLHQRPRRLSFDIETSGPFVRCLGLSGDPSHAICIPFMANYNEQLPQGTLVHFGESSPTRNSYWTPEQEHEILSLLNDLFLDRTVQKVAQNFPFDALVLARDFGLDTSVAMVLDTMVAHHCCYSELPKGLDYLASIYTRVPYYSDHDVSVDRENWLYNCYDAAVTLEISHVLDRELSELGIREHYDNIVNPALLSYTRAETRGIAVDLAARELLKEKTEKEILELTDRITRYSAGKIQNPDSDKQIKDFIYETLKLPVVLHHKTKNPTCDKNARLVLSRRHPEHSPFFEDLEQHSSKSTLMSSFLDRDLGDDKRIRTHYNLAGTVTGRLSSSEPLFDVGTNLQNIPRGTFRRLFTADPGRLLIKADLSQAEFRIVVWKSRVRRIIEKYLEDPTYDVHRWLASEIFGKKQEEITKTERSTAKNGVYGGQYGMYYVTAARTYRLELHMARFVLDRFHSLVPEIEHVFWQEIKRDINTSRRIIGPTGRSRFFFDRLDDELYRTAYSHFAQHLVGELISRAFLLADRIFDEDECYPLLQVHDEIVYQCREELVGKYVPKIRAIMEHPVPFPGVPEPLVIPAEISVGKNWYDQEKV